MNQKPNSGRPKLPKDKKRTQTTLTLDPGVLRDASHLAWTQRRPLSRLVEELLVREMGESNTKNT